MSPKFWFVTGSILGGLGVVIGAFGAHGVGDLLVEIHQDAEPKMVAGHEVPASYKYLQDFKTGAEYQLTHALALLAIGLLGWATKPCRTLSVAGWSFLIGVVFFSGSLYALVLTGQRWWGAVAPIGGTAFIVGWIALAIAGAQRVASPRQPED
ncbi:DUF423 domain-containing protein [Stratiformator vulcanicus]|uniref:DUF423 domain-containing protein n=1 Tax=Stratiformator vulcanicus TaxID=2527980 RepID=A0A517R7J2_9PLAN|nr:DUF423 domain-containing protein [Stratiformator vulcanicus]QDT39859.1 hypothetical protein Pan189_42710 [Stratiformator vulcanicus]